MASWSDQDVRINGTSVMTSQFWIMNRGGLWATPGFRSPNYDVAYLQGTMWRPKQVAEATRTLVFAVDAVNDSGVVPTGALARKAQLNNNMDVLLGLFARENAQVEVERDILMPDGVGGTVLETWTGYAQAGSPILPETVDDFDDYATMSVDLLFADPVWYGSANSPSVSGTQNVTNPGTAQATNMVLTFTGGSNYRLTNNTVLADGNPIWVQIDASGTIVVDVRAGTAFQGSTNVIGLLSKSGTRAFMRLAPGVNSMTLTGGGSVSIAFDTPRL